MLHPWGNLDQNHRESKRPCLSPGARSASVTLTTTPGGPQIASDAGPGPDTPSGTAGPRVLSRGAAEPELGAASPALEPLSCLSWQRRGPQEGDGQPHHLTGTRRLGRARRGVERGLPSAAPAHGGSGRSPKARREGGKGGWGQAPGPRAHPGRRRDSPARHAG